MDPSPLKNRLIKNLKKLRSYLERNKIEAYRLYSKDIPEYPYFIDIYGEKAVIYEQGKKLSSDEEQIREEHQNDIELAIIEVLNIPKGEQFFKKREKQKGLEQYKPLSPGNLDYFVINEYPFKFWVNLERYLDTGLFLDHRPLRQSLLVNSKDKKTLNLFCYTGSLSVASAMGGGMVTSMDMSKTYLDWATENFLLNKLNPEDHRFIQADVLKGVKILAEENEKFDLIILDPPSFSNSKRMEDILDIERDHPLLIRDCMNLLTDKGSLIFSTNKRKFQLHPIVSSQYIVKETSHKTIPQDFYQSNIHSSFILQKRSN